MLPYSKLVILAIISCLYGLTIAAPSPSPAPAPMFSFSKERSSRKKASSKVPEPESSHHEDYDEEMHAHSSRARLHVALEEEGYPVPSRSGRSRSNILHETGAQTSRPLRRTREKPSRARGHQDDFNIASMGAGSHHGQGEDDEEQPFNPELYRQYMESQQGDVLPDFASMSLSGDFQQEAEAHGQSSGRHHGERRRRRSGKEHGSQAGNSDAAEEETDHSQQVVSSRRQSRTSRLSRKSHDQGNDDDNDNQNAVSYHDPSRSYWGKLGDDNQKYILTLINRQRGIVKSDAAQILQERLNPKVLQALTSENTATVSLVLDSLFPGQGGPPVWMENMTEDEGDVLVKRMEEQTGLEEDQVRAYFVSSKLRPSTAQILLKSDQIGLKMFATWTKILLNNADGGETLGRSRVQTLKRTSWNYMLTTTEQGKVIAMVMSTRDTCTTEDAKQILQQHQIFPGFGYALLYQSDSQMLTDLMGWLFGFGPVTAKQRAKQAQMMQQRQFPQRPPQQGPPYPPYPQQGQPYPQQRPGGPPFHPQQQRAPYPGGPPFPHPQQPYPPYPNQGVHPSQFGPPGQFGHPNAARPPFHPQQQPYHQQRPPMQGYNQQQRGSNHGGDDDEDQDGEDDDDYDDE
ncbi:hypothetical protein CBS101457_000240 [Exobasidium rhododendri]|nr:hypothetical protein CBS101457_000240 [Exobasidium rhododendri]